MKSSQNQFADIEAKQRALESHPLFSSIRNLDDLRLFMSWHVFAVWDFMSLLKQLQRQLTTVDLPWIPASNPLAARLINEIVLGEESDSLPGGGYLSHYEMYLLAMKEIGASTRQIEDFVSLLRAGTPFDEALNQVQAHPSIQEFVKSTMHTVSSGNTYQVLGSFFFGRENIIPQMFKSLLANWHIDEHDAPMFVYYLNRHIELDGDSHGPAAWRIINDVTRGNPDATMQLKAAASEAIVARHRLWDGLAQQIG